MKAHAGRSMTERGGVSRGASSGTVRPTGAVDYRDQARAWLIDDPDPDTRAGLRSGFIGCSVC